MCLRSFEFGFDVTSFVWLRMIALMGMYLESVGHLPEETDVIRSPSSRRCTKTSRNGNALPFSSSIVNCLFVNIEFRWALKSAFLPPFIMAKVSST